MTHLLRHTLLALMASITLTASAVAAPGTSPHGRWITESGNLEVDIAPCGTELCGTVVRVISNRLMSASKSDEAMPVSPKTGDAVAADVKGAKILHGLSGSGANEWKGKIYNRENGKTYDCVVTYKAPDQLDVRGYKFLPLFGKTQVWHRVPEKALQ